MSSSYEDDTNNSKCNLIDKILGEMKSEFNKIEKTQENNTLTEMNDNETKNETQTSQVEPPTLTKELPIPDKKVSKTKSPVKIKDEPDEKPRIVLTLRPDKLKQTTKETKPNIESNDSNDKSDAESRRSLRSKPNVNEPELKRSARRRSKDCNESVLQSAIARKEKSYNETIRPQRLSRRLKPTPKILANLEMCQKTAMLKQEKLRLDTKKIKSPPPERKSFDKTEKKNESDESTEKSSDKSEKSNKKRKYKREKFKTPLKKYKRESIDKETDTDEASSSSRQDDEEEILFNENKRSLRKQSEVDIKPSRRSNRKSNRSLDDVKLEEEDGELFLGSLAEESFTAADPESTTIEKTDGSICLCQKSSNVYTAVSTDPVQCAAIDSIDERVIGCNKTVEDESVMMRPSTRVPYLALCRQHLERLLRHNCCPGCGLFCTHGRFSICVEGHTYHRHCEAIANHCPHCASTTQDDDILVSMHCHASPVFLPIQKLPPAKMSLTKPTETIKRAISPPLIERIESLSTSNDVQYNLETVIQSIKDNNYQLLSDILVTNEIDLSVELEESGTLLHLAARDSLSQILHVLVHAGVELDKLDRDQNTPLMLAVLNHQNESVRYLVRAGADSHLRGTDGMTALHLAAKSGNLDAVKILLDSNTQSSNYIDAPDDGGWTALVWASEHGHELIVQELLRRGANPLVRDVEQNVSLHWAAFNGSSIITQMLLDSGCPVSAVNAHGDTPLHVAARQQHFNCTIVLLARGADVQIKNTANEAPVDCCPNPSDCHSAILLNLQLQAVVQRQRRTILTNDVTRGREANPIQCINIVDDEDIPMDFVYITQNYPMPGVVLKQDMKTLQSCKCENKCTNDCHCMQISLGCWYDNEGKLKAEFNFFDPPMIFECNTACRCNAITCNNRLVQHGLTQRFQLFRTNGKGWGIRTLLSIPKGSYICEYIGEIIPDSEADQREDDSYLFDLDNRDGESYCIDAKQYGNLSRFINHSCEPNLLPIRVFIEHQDLRFPRIAFFANRDIKINEELGFDYGEKFWIIKYKSFTCMCQSDSCKYSQQTINDTLDKYNKKLQEIEGISQ